MGLPFNQILETPLTLLLPAFTGDARGLDEDVVSLTGFNLTGTACRENSKQQTKKS